MADLSSPEKVIKVRYSGRRKKRESHVGYDGDTPDMDDEETTTGASLAGIDYDNESQQDGLTTEAPGSSPKTSRSTTTARGRKRAPGSKAPISHSRNSSLATSDSKLSSPGSMKPPSTIPTRKSNSGPNTRMDTPDGSVEEATEVESLKPPRRRKGEAERKQFLEEDPRCAQVEPHRLFCTNCSTWVDLHPKRKYVMKYWIDHRKACCKSSDAPRSNPSESVSGGETERREEDDDAASVAPTPQSDRTRNPPVYKSETEREGILQADPRAEQVRPHEVLCKGCEEWIKLSPVVRFSLTNWQIHSSQCSGKSPKTNGPAENTARDGECSVCHEKVVTEGTADLHHVKWLAHKRVCNPLADQVAVTPVSPSAASASSSNAPRKRAREEEVEEATERSVRARTEEYRAPTGKVSWLWDSLTRPFRSFAQGFREGMGSSM